MDPRRGEGSMEMMPYHPALDETRLEAPQPLLSGGERAEPETTPGADAASADWRQGLPVLHGARLTLRELKTEDAASLCALLTTEEVARFISPPPTSVAGFERFIAWAHRERAAGRYVCFAVVPEGLDVAVGLFQIQLCPEDTQTAEWGFVLGQPYWGTGVFVEGARLVIHFAFEVMGLGRLEARSAVPNGRGNGALRKIGAVREAVLRQSFVRQGEVLDQVLWAIVRADWRHMTGPPSGRIH